MGNSFFVENCFKDAFNYFDRNKDGLINSQDLKDFLAGGSLVIDVSEDKIVKIIEYIDDNHNGVINFEEFSEALKKND